MLVVLSVYTESQVEPRCYQPSDREACLAVFDSQDLQGRDIFDAFLQTGGTDGCTVLEHDGAILACGGYEISPAGTAILRCGMVRRDWERRGLGRFLLLYRLRQLSRLHPGLAFVRVIARAEIAGFYLKQGFKPAGPQADGAIPLAMKMTVCP